jgi:predicted dehydrogenase
MPDYRAAIIGCGRMAHAHARGYLAQPDVTLVACADPLLEARQRFAAEFTIPRTYSSLEELLEADAPDILSICTPHPLHAPLTIAAAQAGARAILCEKPLALTFPMLMP